MEKGPTGNHNTDWMQEAACRPGRGVDLNLFFPESEYEKQQAKEVCDTCPVEEVCLNYAISNSIEYGIWGGMEERERRRYARQLRHRQS